MSKYLGKAMASKKHWTKISDSFERSNKPEDSLKEWTHEVLAYDVRSQLCYRVDFGYRFCLYIKITSQYNEFFTIDKIPDTDLPYEERAQRLGGLLNYAWGNAVTGETFVKAHLSYLMSDMTMLDDEATKSQYWKQIRPELVDTILIDSFFRFGGG